MVPIALSIEKISPARYRSAVDRCGFVRPHTTGPLRVIVALGAMAIQAALSRRTRSGGASSSSAAASRRTAPATPPSSPRRPAAARDRELPDSGGSARSRSAKGSPEQPLDGLRRSPRIAESPIGAIMRGARRTAGVARGAAVLQPDPSTPLPQCIWCWMEQPDHQLKSCPEKRTPNMSDFKQARAVRTRSLGLQRSRGLPSGRTKEEQQAHEATYNTAHKQRTRALVAGAKAALAAHLEAAAQPLTPNGPCAQFTIYQLLALEFASMMDELLPAAVRAKGPVSINSSSVQRFTKLLTKPIGDALSEQAVFKSVGHGGDTGARGGGRRLQGRARLAHRAPHACRRAARARAHRGRRRRERRERRRGRPRLRLIGGGGAGP